MPSVSYSHYIYLLFTTACAVLLPDSCSAPAAAPDPVAGWYEGAFYEGKPFYITKNAISWTSGRKRADFGCWTAVSVYDSSIRLQAEGRRFIITPGYGWDGVTWGSTPPDTCSTMPCCTQK